MTKLRILGIGAGRDGTRAVTELVNRIYQANGLDDASAIHEYCSAEIYERVCSFREEGKHKYLGYIEQIIGGCPVPAIVGNGYAFALDQFLQAGGDGLKLIHLKRRDRAASVRSLAKNARLFPGGHGYYTDAPDVGDAPPMRRTAAFHFGEMTKAAWDVLPIEEKFGWYYDKTHQLIEEKQEAFSDNLTLFTEDLSSPESLEKLTTFVLGQPGIVPQPAHVNRMGIELSGLPTRERLYLQHYFLDFDLGEASTNETYMMKHFGQQFLRWWYHLFGHLDDFPQKDGAYLLALLDDAERALNESLLGVQHARQVMIQSQKK